MIKRFSFQIALVFLINLTPVNLRGLHYEHISKGNFLSIHVLIVNPSEHEIAPVKAIKRETVLTLSNSYGAIAAINGGFWKENGDPSGILKINHHWCGTPIKPRAALGWSHDGQTVFIDRVLTNHHLLDCPPGSKINVIPVTGSDNSTSEDWLELEHIVGGGPLLVRNNIIVEDFSIERILESFLLEKTSRTAVGIRDNGDWVIVVVDSHFFGLVGGLRIRELAQLMLSLGCVNALNLDGGSSSTMVIGNKVINKTFGEISEHGKHVQAVSDAILIFPRMY